MLDTDISKDPNYFTKGWIPQIELLSHPAVKAGLNHCGWGGCMEFASNGVPMVTWPHFADQFENSDVLVNAGIAIKLHGTRRYQLNEGEFTTARKPVFTA